MSQGEFSVAQFFKDGNWAYEVRWVDVDEAMEKFVFLTTNVASKLGVVERVIVTDGGDFTNIEWIYSKGITYPPELVGKILSRRSHLEDREN